MAEGTALISGLWAFAEGREGEGGGNHLAVPDPFGGDDEVYEGTFVSLEDLVEKALTRLGEGRELAEAGRAPDEVEDSR